MSLHTLTGHLVGTRPPVGDVAADTGSDVLPVGASGTYVRPAPVAEYDTPYWRKGEIVRLEREAQDFVAIGDEENAERCAVEAANHRQALHDVGADVPPPVGVVEMPVTNINLEEAA